MDNRSNKQWVWLALDVDTRAIVNCSIGDRSGDAAWVLWELLPGRASDWDGSF